MTDLTMDEIKIKDLPGTLNRTVSGLIDAIIDVDIAIEALKLEGADEKTIAMMGEAKLFARLAHERAQLIRNRHAGGPFPGIEKKAAENADKAEMAHLSCVDADRAAHQASLDLMAKISARRKSPF